MGAVIDWLTTDWSGGYLLGSLVGVLVWWMFRNQDRATTVYQYGRRQANLIVGVAARALLTTPQEGTYEDGVMHMTVNVLGLNDEEQRALMRIIEEIQTELREEA